VLSATIIATGETVTASLLNWFSPPGSQPLTYAFGYVVADSARGDVDDLFQLACLPSASHYRTLILPAGLWKVRDSGCHCFVVSHRTQVFGYVIDAHGLTATATAVVRVLPPASTQEAYIAAVRAYIVQAQRIGIEAGTEEDACTMEG
jgi:hypothetical protein